MNSQEYMSTLSLVFAFVLVLIGLAVNFKEKLGLEKDIIVGITRMIVQLFLVSMVLKYIFDADHKIITVAVVAIMCLNAGYNASLRGKDIPNSLKISMVSILGGVVVSLAILVITGAIKFTAQQMIPVTGMLAGNSMNIIGLSFRNLKLSFKDNRQKVEEKLSLGATVREASKEIMKEAIKGATQPTVDRTKTVGLVALPGMMSGMMVAGADPMVAIKYQIMVFFMLIATAMITAYLTVYQTAPAFYEDGRLQ